MIRTDHVLGYAIEELEQTVVHAADLAVLRVWMDDNATPEVQSRACIIPSHARTAWSA